MSAVTEQDSECLQIRTVTVAVAGNPNSGKSTLINAIAGSRLHVGNWPGVTVEKKSASLEYEGRKIKLVDLPGTYSLSPYTEEEIIARDYLIHDKPDVIINVVDATNLERNLYLSIQLLELEIPMVVALNIYDEAEKKGYRVDVEKMAKILGVPVVMTVATKNKGLDTLMHAALEAAEKSGGRPRELHYDEDIESAASAISDYLTKNHPSIIEKYPLRWLSLKLMEGDSLIMD
ncbi:MAG: FeoB small GTPase domain-containing protein, partial [Armatimonadota bacterium]